MNSDFHFREKIAVGLLNPPAGLTDRLTAHPWFLVDNAVNSPLLIATGPVNEGSPDRAVISLQSRVEPTMALDINRWEDLLLPLNISFPSEAALGLALALKPLHERFGLLAVNTAVLLPILGAQQPLASIELIDNVVPGTDEVAAILRHEFEQLLSLPTGLLGVQCLRVPVSQGMTMSVSVKLERSCALSELEAAWMEFQGHTLRKQLPSALEPPLTYRPDATFPQPRLRTASTLIGQLRPCPAFDYQFVVVASDPINHLLMLAEALVVSGRIFW